MIVECAKCQTKFKVADDKITPAGIKVRCSRCKNVFMVKRESRVTPPPLSQDLAFTIDLDSDFPIPAPESLPPRPPPPPAPPPPVVGRVGGSPATPKPATPKPAAPKPAAPAIPKPAARTHAAQPEKTSLDEDLFGNLEAEIPDYVPQPPAHQASGPAPVSPALDGDPFADLNLEAEGIRLGMAAISAEPPASDGDLFSNLDLPSGQPAPIAKGRKIAPSPVASKPVPASPAGDLFGGSEDPFAGIAAGPRPAGGSATASVPLEETGRLGDDLFPSEPDVATPALVDQKRAGGIGMPVEDSPFPGFETFSAHEENPAKGTAEPLVGHDPFAEMDSGGGAETPADGSAEPSGLALDLEGNLTGHDLPPTPPPTRSQTEKPQPSIGKEKSVVFARLTPVQAPVLAPAPGTIPTGPLIWMYKVGFGLLLFVLILLGFLIYRGGGKTDLTKWSTYVEAFTGRPPADQASTDVVAVNVSSTAYPNRYGRNLVVLWGEVDNPTQEAKRRVTVTGQLILPNGEVAGEFTAPAGVSFMPDDVHAMIDRRAVEAAYRSKLPTVAALEVPPGKTIPFMLVFPDHPPQLDGLRVRVVAEVSKHPNLGLPPEPVPTPASVTPRPAPVDTKDGRAIPAAMPTAGKKPGTIVRLQPPPEKARPPGVP